MPEIIFENSGWWLVPITLVSLAVAWVLYFKGKAFAPNQRRILFVLRFFIFFLLGLLLLSPLFKITERTEEKPVLVWLEDHSSSMLAHDDSAEVREQLLGREQFREKLAEKYRLQSFDFAKGLMAAGDSFSGAGTDLNAALTEVQERFYNQNVGGVVLLTDGIYNQGSEPSYTAEALPYPVFSVGFGDTTVPRDLFIDRLVHNEVTYLDNEFPVEVYVKARELEGEDYSLTVRNTAGQQVHQASFDITSGDYFHRADFFLKATEPGLQRYQVILSPAGEEENPENNTAYFSIEVISNRKTVSLVASGPHPDMAAISAALESVEKYEVKTYIERSLPGENQESDLVILHNPSAALLQRFVGEDTPSWIVQGPETPAEALAQYTPVNSGGKGFEEVMVHFSGNFDLFKVNDDERNFVEDLPPLWGPFGRATSELQSYVLFNKQVGAVKTQDPLWFFISRSVGEGVQQRQAYTLGTGFWRWRIQDYRENRSHANFDGLVQKSVQYLTTRDRRNRFDVDINTRFDREENIVAEARLFNPSMELTNEPEVDIRFTSEEEKTYDFTFSRAQNTYRLNAGRLPAGIYTWRAQTSLGDEEFQEVGSVVVEESNIEQTDLVARHGLLRKIADESGGNFFKAGDWQSLRENLLQNPAAKNYQVMETTTGSIIDKRWIFAVFLLLLTLEWGLRKYFGNY